MTTTQDAQGNLHQGAGAPTGGQFDRKQNSRPQAPIGRSRGAWQATIEASAQRSLDELAKAQTTLAGADASVAEAEAHARSNPTSIAIAARTRALEARRQARHAVGLAAANAVIHVLDARSPGFWEDLVLERQWSTKTFRLLSVTIAGQHHGLTAGASSTPLDEATYRQLRELVPLIEHAASDVLVKTGTYSWRLSRRPDRRTA